MVYQRKQRAYEQEPLQVPQVKNDLFASPDVETEEADTAYVAPGPTAAPNWEAVQRQIDNPVFDFGKISILPPDSAVQRQPVDPSTLSKRERFIQRAFNVQREPVVSSMPGPPGPLDHHFVAPREDGLDVPLARPLAIQRQAKMADQGTGAIAQSGTVNLTPQGSGRPLPKQVSDPFVQSGYPEVQQARVHVDDAATQSIQAKAYTQKNNIVVQSSGANDPKLLGHEATHVVQQSQMALKPDVNGTPINANPALEKNADDNGERVARHESVKVKGASVTGQPETGMDGANRPPVQRREDGIIQRYIEGRTTSDRNPKAAQKYLEKLGYTENVAKEVVKLATVTESGRKFRYSNLARIAKIMTTKGISANAAFVLNNAPPAPNRPVPNAPPPLPLRPVLGAPVGINNNNAIVNNNNNNNNQHHNAAANNNNVDANNNQLLNANNGNGASLNNVEDQYEAEEKLEELKNSKAKPAKNNNNNQKLNIEEKWDENDDEFNDDHNDAKEDISNNNNNSLPNAPLNNGQAPVDFGAAQTNFNVKFSGPVQFPGKKAWLSPDEWMQHSQVQIRGLESEEKKEQAKDINKENSKIESTNLASSSPVSKQQNNLNQGSENIVYLKSVAYLLEQLGFKKHALEKYEIINITTNNGIERLLMLLQVLRTKFETLGLVSESENRDKAEAIYGVLDIINKDLGNYYSSNDLPQPRIYDLLEDIDEFMSKISSYAPNEDEEDYDLENIVHLKDEADILNQFDLKEYAIKVDITTQKGIERLLMLLRALKEKFGQLGLVSESENKDKAKAIYGILCTIDTDLKKYYENNDPLQPSIKPIGYLLEDMYELMHSISSYLPNQVKKKYPDKNEFDNDEKVDINNNNPKNQEYLKIYRSKDQYFEIQNHEIPAYFKAIYQVHPNPEYLDMTLEKLVNRSEVLIDKTITPRCWATGVDLINLPGRADREVGRLLPVVWPENVQKDKGTVYRGDTRPPWDDSLEKGFKPWSEVNEKTPYSKNLYRHVDVTPSPDDSAYVSTTTDFETAKRFANGGYIYKFKKQEGIHVPTRLTTKYPEEGELSIPRTIPLGEVQSVQRSDRILEGQQLEKIITKNVWDEKIGKTGPESVKGKHDPEITWKEYLGIKNVEPHLGRYGDNKNKENGERWPSKAQTDSAERRKIFQAMQQRNSTKEMIDKYGKSTILQAIAWSQDSNYKDSSMSIAEKIKKLEKVGEKLKNIFDKLDKNKLNQKQTSMSAEDATLIFYITKIDDYPLEERIGKLKAQKRKLEEEERRSQEKERELKDLKEKERELKVKMALEKNIYSPEREILKFVKEDIGIFGHKSLMTKDANIFRKLTDYTLKEIIKKCKDKDSNPYDFMKDIAQKEDDMDLQKEPADRLFKYIKMYWDTYWKLQKESELREKESELRELKERERELIGFKENEEELRELKEKEERLKIKLALEKSSSPEEAVLKLIEGDIAADAQLPKGMDIFKAAHLFKNLKSDTLLDIVKGCILRDEKQRNFIKEEAAKNGVDLTGGIAGKLLKYIRHYWKLVQG